MLTASPHCNITLPILNKVGRNLHHQEHHPLNIIKTIIEDHFSKTFRQPSTSASSTEDEPVFRYFDNMSPRVTTQQCFDDLLIQPDHVSRAVTDTYYFDETSLLRPHTSAHQTELMRAGHKAFLATGDCYRRDEIDYCHYPVFHQMEGVRLWPCSEVDDAYVIADLKSTLEGLVRRLFGDDIVFRWDEAAYFPFTEPSLELEIWSEERQDWLEVLGSGVIHTDILRNVDMADHRGWAFGLGLERWAMTLFDIPDIRLFWSEDPRFLTQFRPSSKKTEDGREFVRFAPFSKYPPCFKDISFWTPESYHANDFAAIVRDVAGDLVESVTLTDEFTHPKTQRLSVCYRITYRSMSASLVDDDVNALQEKVRQLAVDTLAVELR